MLIINFLDDVTYSDSGVSVSVLANDSRAKEIRITFKSGQQMKEHSAPFPISVMILDGSIDFGVEGVQHRLNRGDLIKLDASVVHELLAIEDAVVQLTLSKHDTIKRVEGVIKL